MLSLPTGAAHIYSLLKDISRDFTGAPKQNITPKDNPEYGAISAPESHARNCCILTVAVWSRRYTVRTRPRSMTGKTRTLIRWRPRPSMSSNDVSTDSARPDQSIGRPVSAHLLFACSMLSIFSKMFVGTLLNSVQSLSIHSSNFIHSINHSWAPYDILSRRALRP